MQASGTKKSRVRRETVPLKAALVSPGASSSTTWLINGGFVLFLVASLAGLGVALVMLAEKNNKAAPPQPPMPPSPPNRPPQTPLSPALPPSPSPLPPLPPTPPPLPTWPPASEYYLSSDCSRGRTLVSKEECAYAYGELALNRSGSSYADYSGALEAQDGVGCHSHSQDYTGAVNTVPAAVDTTSIYDFLSLGWYYGVCQSVHTLTHLCVCALRPDTRWEATPNPWCQTTDLYITSKAECAAAARHLNRNFRVLPGNHTGCSLFTEWGYYPDAFAWGEATTVQETHVCQGSYCACRA